MKQPTDPVALRQSLLQLLESAPPDEEKLLAKLEGDAEEGHPLYSTALYILTHLSFPEAEARRHWRKIVAHRDLLRMELNRDVGLRVSLLDYFVNVNRELKNPKVIEISIYERTERSAITDGLTGLFNHAYFLHSLKREIQRSKRHKLRLALVLFDIDYFKKINDTLGHVGGDRVLVKVAALIRESLRDVDLAARYGGEEFAVILPDTAREGACLVAERVRARIETHFRRRRGHTKVTISGGIALCPDDADDAEELVKGADQGLYRSKAEGKNRITLAGGERRRHRRIPASHPLKVVPGGGRRQSAALARNVSEGGLLVSLKDPVAVGSTVSLVIRSESDMPIGLRGEVVRVDKGEKKGYDVGVRLVNLTDETLGVLRRMPPARPGEM